MRASSAATAFRTAPVRIIEEDGGEPERERLPQPRTREHRGLDRRRTGHRLSVGEVMKPDLIEGRIDHGQAVLIAGIQQGIIHGPDRVDPNPGGPGICRNVETVGDRGPAILRLQHLHRIIIDQRGPVFDGDRQ